MQWVLLCKLAKIVQTAVQLLNAYNYSEPLLSHLLLHFYFSNSLYTIISPRCVSIYPILYHPPHPRSDQPAGSLRLFGADSTTQGRVEILYSGRWGAVCDTLWDDGDGEVACRQLGVRGAVDTNPFTWVYTLAEGVRGVASYPCCQRPVIANSFWHKMCKILQSLHKLSLMVIC